MRSKVVRFLSICFLVALFAFDIVKRSVPSLDPGLKIQRLASIFVRYARHRTTEQYSGVGVP